tara:strand:+ start:198 stop:410 length:213 start_codon:yes stop_codon:yes gene_type:complete
MTPSQVIKQLNELKEEWRNQSFKYTPEQQKEYDKLIKLRRERVKYFYDNDLVSKGTPKKVDKTNQKNTTT